MYGTLKTCSDQNSFRSLILNGSVTKIDRNPLLASSVCVSGCVTIPQSYDICDDFDNNTQRTWIIDFYSNKRSKRYDERVRWKEAKK